VKKTIILIFFNCNLLISGVTCNIEIKIVNVTVLNVHGMHASAGWPKQGLRVLATMPTVGEIGSVDLCGCRFVKGKSAAQIVDEHWLDDGMSKPGRKIRQGHRQTRTGAVEKFDNEDIGSLHADANLAARSGLCKSGA